MGSPSLPTAMLLPAGRSGLFCSLRPLDARDARGCPEEPEACRRSWCDTIAGFVTTNPLFTRFCSIWRQSSQYTPDVAGFPQIVQYPMDVNPTKKGIDSMGNPKARLIEAL